MKFNTDLPNPFTTAKPGIINGLIVNIFDGLFNESRKNDFNLITNGLQVIIHSNSIQPDPQEGAIARAGFASFLKIKKTLNSKLSEPYNDCIETLEGYNSFNTTIYKAIVDANYTYTQKNCLDFAFLRSIWPNATFDRPFQYFDQSLLSKLTEQFFMF